MTLHKIQKYPRQSIKEAKFNPLDLANTGYKAIKGGLKNFGGSAGRNLQRQGSNLLDYGKKLVTNPIKTLKHNALTAGATVRDKEKQFDVLENSLESMLRDKKKIHFSALDQADPNAGIVNKGIKKLRDEGIFTAGRRTKGTISDAAHADMIKKMESKGLIHRSGKKKDVLSIHRDADVDELRKIYDEVQGLDVASGPGMIDSARNMLNYAPLPGERGMLGLGIVGSAAPQLANKETKDGRQRGLAERIGRAGLMTAAELAVAPIGVANRLYGGLGTATEIGGTLGTELLLNKNNKSNAANALSNQRMGQAAMKKPALNVPGSPGSMQKQANRLTDAYEAGVDALSANAYAAVQSMMRPITIGKEMAEAVRDKDKQMLLLAPGTAAGYGALGYGGYKGGQKVKEKIKKRREKQEKTASIPKNPRARLRRALK